MGGFFSMVIYHPYMDNDLDGTNAVPDTILNMTNVHLLDETPNFDDFLEMNPSNPFTSLRMQCLAFASEEWSRKMGFSETSCIE